MAQWLRSLVAFVKNPGLIPRMHMDMSDHLFLSFQRTPCSLLGLLRCHSPDTWTCVKQNTHIHKIEINIYFKKQSPGSPQVEKEAYDLK